MKYFRKSSVLLLLFTLIISMCSCIGGEVTVKYVYNDGREDVQLSATRYTTAKKPSDPVKEGYIFDGWYRDSECTEPYDFSDTLTKDITLYAGWLVNYEKLSTKISVKGLRASVLVKVIDYEQIGIATYATNITNGSGVIYKKALGYYYLLTNSHVAEGAKNHKISKTEYKICDAFGEEYSAELIYSDPLYDLALMRFQCGENELEALEIKKGVPSRDEVVVAIGNPRTQINTVTYGKLKDFRAVDVMKDNPTLSDVSFEVLWHTAYTDKGSSGGALLNSSLEIVGINFATAADEGGKFAYGFAIPADKVIEFLETAENAV